jgi:hypothetical protein
MGNSCAPVDDGPQSGRSSLVANYRIELVFFFMTKVTIYLTSMVGFYGKIFLRGL